MAGAAYRWVTRVLAIACGCVLALAFPAADVWWLAWIALVPLLSLCARAHSYREAALLAALAATGFFSVLLHWLTPHLGVFSAPIAVVAGVLWVPVGLVSRRLLGEPSVGKVAAATVVVPSVWVSIEVVRSWHHFGGGWGVLGLSQWKARPVLALASLGGVWLISFALVAVSVGAVAALAPRADRATRLLGGAVAVAVTALVLGHGWLRPEPEVTGTLRIAGVQPGPGYAAEERFAVQMELTGLADADLIVWGQSSVGVDLATRPDLTARLRQAGTDVLVNVDARTADGRIRKTTHHYSPDGLVATYTKQRLVPFGEYVPFRSVLGGLLGGTGVADEDRATGTGPTILWVDGVRVGPLISYEALFPDMRRALVRLGADVTVVQGSLTSYQGSWAHPQQASVEAVRAVESGRSSVLVELTGTSAAFDAEGRPRAWLPPDERGIFTVDVPLYAGTTGYVRWGDWLPVLAGAITAIGAAAIGLRTPVRPAQAPRSADRPPPRGLDRTSPRKPR